MKRTLISTLALSAAVLGLAGCGDEQEAPNVSSNPHVAICGGQSETKPTEMLVGCDGTVVFKNLTWSSWDNERAVGTGTLETRSCDPNCAQGKTSKAESVTVTLSDPAEDGRFQKASYDGETKALS